MLNLFSSQKQRKQKRHLYSNSSRQSFSVDWVLPSQLAVGRLPNASDCNSLSHSGVKAILALCSESEGIWLTGMEHHFNCHRIVIPDSHYTTPLQPTHVARAVDYIHGCIEHRLPVYVHCLAGVERSPTICTAYLCRYRNYTLWESLNWVKQIHPNSLPTEQQIQVIRDYLTIYTPRTA